MAINFNSVNKGLALHLPLDQTHKQSATVYSDLSAQSNHGTAVNAPTATTDRFGRENMALAFNGSTQYVDLSSSGFLAAYAGDTKGSISVWFKTTENSKTIFSLSEGTVNNFVQVVTLGDKIRIGLRTTADAITINSDDTVTDNQWHNVVLTQNGTVSRLYIDGILQSDDDSGEWFSNMSNLSYSRIGNLYYNGSNGFHFPGSIADIRYYSGRALSQAEVQALYRLGGTGNIIYSGV